MIGVVGTPAAKAGGTARVSIQLNISRESNAMIQHVPCFVFYLKSYKLTMRLFIAKMAP